MDRGCARRERACLQSSGQWPRVRSRGLRPLSRLGCNSRQCRHDRHVAALGIRLEEDVVLRPVHVTSVSRRAPCGQVLPDRAFSPLRDRASRSTEFDLSQLGEPSAERSRAFAFWSDRPLYVRILIGLVVGAVLGVVNAKVLEWPARMVLRALGAVAPVLIVTAVLDAILNAEIRGRMALKLCALLVLNTVVAILVGLLVANTLKPGAGTHLAHPGQAPEVKGDIVKQLIDNVPDSLLRPFVENNVIGVVLIAVAFGIAARRLAPEHRTRVAELVSLGFAWILIVLALADRARSARRPR